MEHGVWEDMFDEMYELEQQHASTYGDRCATEAEAHAEWHLNAGHPMDQPGCPWDCCDPDPDFDDEELERHGLARFRPARLNLLARFRQWRAHRAWVKDVERAAWEDADIPF